MSDIRQLYQETILEHNKNPRNFGTLPDALYHAEGHNPICGDHIIVALNIYADKIIEIAFTGESCAICKASASMLTVAIKGKAVVEAGALIEEFRAMATGKLDLETTPNHLGKLKVFAGVRNLPSRVKCAILPWHTLFAALNSELSVTTETDVDPLANVLMKEE